MSADLTPGQLQALREIPGCGGPHLNALECWACGYCLSRLYAAIASRVEQETRERDVAECQAIVEGNDGLGMASWCRDAIRALPPQYTIPAAQPGEQGT